MKRILDILRPVLVLIALGVLAPAAQGYANTPPIDPLYNSRIMDDEVALNAGAMSLQDIQNFLNSKVPTCDTNHQGGLAQYPPPYTCLKDYVDPTTQKKAAQIIYEEATSVGLNPQVILVTLQKEQSLVTDTWPYPSQYRDAMGYGCPESQSVCDSQYSGLYNQIHLGARLLRAGIARNCGDTQTLPGWSLNSKWRVGNTPAVDTKPTFLATCVTGSFYNYTPHRPDSAYTLNAGTYYYGNYNFINFYTSWFGSTWSNKLVRGSGSPSVYLLSQSRKYYIGSSDMLDTFRNFGPVRTIDQGFLDTVTSGPSLSHFVVSPTSGAVYLIDAGNKLHFNTCSDVTTFGGSCSNLTTLPDGVINAFITGPTVTAAVSNEIGMVFKMEDGRKRAVVDLEIYHESGLDSVPPLGLSNVFMGTFYDGPPVLRNQSVNINQDSGAVYLGVSGSLRYIGSMGLLSDWRFDGLPHYRYPGGTLEQTAKGSAITAFATDGSSTVMIDGRSKRSLGSSSAEWGSVPLTSLPSNLLSAIPAGEAVGTKVVAKETGAVYYIEDGKKRQVPSIQDFNRLGLTNNALAPVSVNALGALADGTPKFGPLRLLKTASSGLITMVDGSGAWRVPSPQVAATLGLDLNGAWTVSQGIFDAYPASAFIGQLWADGSNQYVVDNGSRHLLSGATATAYGFSGGSFQTVGSATAGALAAGADMTRLIKGSGSSIYYVESGQRRHVVSGATYNSLGGGAATQTVTDAFLNSIPTGANLN